MDFNVENPLSAVLNIGTKIIDKIWPDPTAAADAKLKLLTLYQSGDLQLVAEESNIIQAETKSESWITASWRPIIMLLFGAIIANNYIIYPYLRLFFPSAPLLPLPPEMWDLLKLGIGGYVIGRSAEKMMPNIASMFGKGDK